MHPSGVPTFKKSYIKISINYVDSIGVHVINSIIIHVLRFKLFSLICPYYNKLFSDFSYFVVLVLLSTCGYSIVCLLLAKALLPAFLQVTFHFD